MIALYVKNIYIRRQTTFVRGKCKVPLCSPELTEQPKAPRDCFKEYHNNHFCDHDFFKTNYNDILSNNSDDNFKKKPKAKGTRHEWTDNCVQFADLQNFWCSVFFGQIWNEFGCFCRILVLF